MQKAAMRKIEMVDLKSQYARLKPAIDAEMQKVIDSTAFIKGPQVAEFEKELAAYLGVKHVIGCANGTDALQIALMALDLPAGSEIITPSFSYAALAEVILLMGLKPVFVEVEPDTYLIDTKKIEALINPNTRCIAPVHLYGQCANMDEVLALASTHKLKVVEDTAQAIGAKYTGKSGTTMSAGTMGDIGTTSFFPSKNLGCFGDGGALFTNNDELANRIKMIANHGQSQKYVHTVIGLNSRLDTLQAAVLLVKLKELNAFAEARNTVANFYDKELTGLPLSTPKRAANSSHVFHQYTLSLHDAAQRDDLKNYLAQHEVPSMIYYPIALHKQEAYKQLIDMPITNDLCSRVLSLPISTEMDKEQLNYIVNTIKDFFKK
jgi:UDP-2-acetamido-2-deoxy-ribo-hexuluronate aminotransferase